MLIQFSIENYLSFKEKQIFTTIANADQAHKENLIEMGKKRYSKINVMYGANASGKSNFIKALSFLQMYVFNSNNILEGTNSPVMPFKFDEDTINKPSKFEIIFVKNKIKYDYSVVFDKSKVYEEYLYVYESVQPTTIFERTNINEYKFNSDISILNDIKTKNTSNKLFLTTATNWNYEKTKPVVDYILNDLFIILDYKNNMFNHFEKLKENNEFESYKKFALNILSQGDIHLNDFIYESKVVENKDTINNFINTMKIQMPFNAENPNINLKEVKLNTIHQFNKNNNIYKYSLELFEESLGTQSLLEFTPILYEVFKNGKTLIIDELGNSMHPHIVEYIVKLFIDEKVNLNNSQLIFNTHDTNLLDLELFRRDEIWFTEKDNNTGKTTIYPLTDYSPRNQENIEKGYLLGRYGAIPFISNGNDLWE